MNSAPRRGGAWGALLGVLGFGMAARAITNTEISELLGLEPETHRRPPRLTG